MAHKFNKEVVHFFCRLLAQCVWLSVKRTGKRVTRVRAIDSKFRTTPSRAQAVPAVAIN